MAGVFLFVLIVCMKPGNFKKTKIKIIGYYNLQRVKRKKQTVESHVNKTGDFR